MSEPHHYPQTQNKEKRPKVKRFESPHNITVEFFATSIDSPTIQMLYGALHPEIKTFQRMFFFSRNSEFLFEKIKIPSVDGRRESSFVQ